MIKSFIMPIGMAVSLWGPPVNAYDVLLNVSGSITSATCDIDSSTKDFEVKLGNIPSTEFASPGAVSPDVRFSILLKNCNALTTGVKIGFYGTQDGNDPTLLALTPGGATGIGISIIDASKKKMPINIKSESHPLTPSADNELVFYGRYMSSSKTVTPGIANATASFMLEYN